MWPEAMQEEGTEGRPRGHGVMGPANGAWRREVCRMWKGGVQIGLVGE